MHVPRHHVEGMGAVGHPGCARRYAGGNLAGGLRTPRCSARGARARQTGVVGFPYIRACPYDGRCARVHRIGPRRKGSFEITDLATQEGKQRRSGVLAQRRGHAGSGTRRQCCHSWLSISFTDASIDRRFSPRGGRPFHRQIIKLAAKIRGWHRSCIESVEPHSHLTGGLVGRQAHAALFPILLRMHGTAWRERAVRRFGGNGRRLGGLWARVRTQCYRFTRG